MPPDGPAVRGFVEAATSGRCERARRLLDDAPEVADDPWARLVLGRGWDGDAREPGGPLGWAPLLYVTHSCFASAELARQLLANGADPNVSFRNRYGAMSALYGAAGVVHDPDVTRVLLEAGADPDDGESVYHATEAEDPACLRLLLEHGAEPRGTNALAHALDADRREHVRLLLDAGADPNEGALLVHAVRRGCSLETIRLLADRGAAIDRRGGEWSTPRPRYKTAYQNAVLRGRDDVAALLAERGASTALEPEDAAVAAVAQGREPPHPLPADLGPDAQEVLVLAALDGRLEHVVQHVGVGFHGHAGGGPPGTILHHAAWVGNAPVVRALLARGADPRARSGAEFDEPAAWAALGSQAHALPGRDYVGVLEALVAAGAPLEPRFAEVAEGPLAEWLAARS
jgi:ankyrin repeat protein